MADSDTYVVSRHKRFRGKFRENGIMSQAAICMAAGSLTKGTLHISEKKVLCKSLSRDEIIQLFEDSDYYCYSNSNYMSICSEHFAKKSMKKNSLNLKTFE